MDDPTLNDAPAPEDQNVITKDEQAEKEAANQDMRDMGEPVKDAYSEGVDESNAADKPAETIVENPLAPTDTNPNPHGTRDEPFVSVPVKDEDGKIGMTQPEEGDVEITSSVDGLHLGDGRVLHNGGKAKVTEEVAKILTDNKQATRG